MILKKWWLLVNEELMELEKNKFLLSLQKEIENLEQEIREGIVNNKINQSQRKKKINSTINRLIIPYILATGLTLTSFTLLGKTPFYQDLIKNYLYERKEFDSLGNSKYEEQYKEYEDEKSTLTYATKWLKNENGLYERTLKTYQIKDLDEAKIKKIVQNKEINSLEEIFGKPIMISTEIEPNLTQEQLKEDSYLQAIIYLENKDKFVYVKESILENAIGAILIYLAIIALIKASQQSKSKFNYDEIMMQINQEYPDISFSDLEKKLVIKKANYQKLTR